MLDSYLIDLKYFVECHFTMESRWLPLPGTVNFVPARRTGRMAHNTVSIFLFIRLKNLRSAIFISFKLET